MRRWVLILILIAFGPARAGGLYYFIDQKGVYHFSDVRKDDKYNKMIVWADAGGGSRMDIQVDFDRYIKDACASYGLDENLVRAMIKVESNYDPKAVSRSGAQGLMQLMPATAQLMRLIDPYHPRDNIYAGVAYFKSLLSRYQGNEALALAAYNAGPSCVDKYLGIPPYAETRNYVKKVQSYRDKYEGKNLSVRYQSRVVILSERTVTRK